LLWQPHHPFRGIALSGATDPDGDSVTLRVTGVTQDEPLKGKDDASAPDARLVPAPNKVDLRAERNGNGNGRVYRIAFTADDGNGGTCSGTVKVSVPKSMGKNGAAVESPASFDSLAR
jgi:hypothetical protein